MEQLFIVLVDYFLQKEKKIYRGKVFEIKLQSFFSIYKINWYELFNESNNKIFFEPFNYKYSYYEMKTLIADGTFKILFVDNNLICRKKKNN